MIVGLALSPSLDVTYIVDDLQLGEISVPSRVVRSAGGKTLNASRVAASLGSSVAAIAVVGGSTGERIASMLESTRVGLTRIESSSETRTCISIASGTSVGLTELYEPAAPFAPEVWRAVLAELTALAAPESTAQPESAQVAGRAESGPSGGGWLLLAGSVPQGVPLDELVGALGAIRNRGVRVAIDTHGAALEAVVAAGAADLIKVNRAEAVALVGLDSGTDLTELTLALQSRAGCLVVVTDGVHGSLASDGVVAVRVQPDPVSGRFPVGSGDSYFGGLVHALDAGDPLEQALVTAASCASANALEPGAAVFDLAAVEAARSRLSVRTSLLTEVS